MKIYVVGGAVRDVLMGAIPNDIDYVVEGSTHDEMISLGYSKVGAFFPVYLCPKTNHEYALARTEQSNGPGYNDFGCVIENVTLEQDLLRRDLTINAMAVPIEHWESFKEQPNDHAQLIDPFNGKHDLASKILRHVSDAFCDDPVRMLRIARFSASYDFGIASKTLTMLKKMSDEQMFNHLTTERIWKEVEKALNTKLSYKFFNLITVIGANEQVFKQKHVISPDSLESFAQTNLHNNHLVQLTIWFNDGEQLLTRLLAPSALIQDHVSVLTTINYIQNMLIVCPQEERDYQFWALFIATAITILDGMRVTRRLEIAKDIVRTGVSDDELPIAFRYIDDAIEILQTTKFADLVPEQQQDVKNIKAHILRLAISRLETRFQTNNKYPI